MIEQYTPIVETYIQELSLKDNRLTPSSDHYFISQAKLSPSLKAEAFKNRENTVFTFLGKHIQDATTLGMDFLADGFLNMIYPDPDIFDRQHYRFEYVGREFLGEVRCLMFDVSPLGKAKQGMFGGRIWVEDQDYTIVRYNGVFLPKKKFKGAYFDYYFHFDSWRFNAQGNLWLPATVYSEETDVACCLFWKFNYRKLRFKAQTRFWGYNVGNRRSNQEFAKILIDPQAHINDPSESNQDLSPIQAQRAWERQAEDNVLDIWNESA